MNIAIIGLGLIGGSLGRSLCKKTEHKIFAMDIDEKAMKLGKLLGAYHEPLSKDNIKEMDMVIFSLYPESLKKSLDEFCPLLKNGALVMDCCGNKRAVAEQMSGLSQKYPNLEFISSHPMAGREFSGVSHSTNNLFDKASMILVPVKVGLKTIQSVKELSLEIGFGSVVISTAKEHDRIIAYTSQLAHLVSSAYMKSPTATSFMGFSAGSFRDMTRVARLSPEMWSQLTIENADFLVGEIDNLIGSLTEYKNALKNGDKVAMKELLADGNDKKLLSEKMRRSKNNEE